jgi:hypothetical protein
MLLIPLPAQAQSQEYDGLIEPRMVVKWERCLWIIDTVTGTGDVLKQGE